MSHKATGVKGGKGSVGLRPDTDIPIRNMSQQHRAPAECTCTGGLPCVIALWVSMSKQQISFEWLIWNKVAQETSGDECLLPRAKKNGFGKHIWDPLSTASTGEMFDSGYRQDNNNREQRQEEK